MTTVRLKSRGLTPVLAAILVSAITGAGCARYPAAGPRGLDTETAPLMDPTGTAATTPSARDTGLSAAAVPPAATPAFPGESWESAAGAEILGWSREGLDAAAALAAKLRTTGLVVVCGGRVILEHGDVTELSYLASVRKSVLAMLFGNYVASGQVRLDKTLAECGISDHGGLSAQELEAKIGDLLAARSGVYHPASNPGDNLADAPPRGSQRPGEYFLYSNWDFNALGTIFERETGRNIYDALESDLAVPIGMEDFDRAAQRKSGDLSVSVHPAYHMWLSTRDMARLGYLMLREGNWNGRQVIPREWVRTITSPMTRVDTMNPASLRNGALGYGYLWWVFDGPKAAGAFEGGYTGRGAGGQYITVLPRVALVIAHKTNMSRSGSEVGWKDYERLMRAILAARRG